MNRLIAELTAEANNQTGNGFDLNHKPLDALLNKFARLIIDECIKIGHETSNGIFAMSKAPGDMFEYKSHGAEDVVDNIKEHFGV